MKEFHSMSPKTLCYVILSSHFKILSVSTHMQTVLTCGNEVIMMSSGSAQTLAHL